MLVSVRKRTRTAGGIPASRTARDRTPGRFLLRRIAHWATASFAPQPCENNCRCRDEILRKAQDDIRDTDNSVENSAWMALFFGIDGVCVEAVR